MRSPTKGSGEQRHYDAEKRVFSHDQRECHKSQHKDGAEGAPARAVSTPSRGCRKAQYSRTTKGSAHKSQHKDGAEGAPARAASTACARAAST
jgi:hypothetical protein